MTFPLSGKRYIDQTPCQEYRSIPFAKADVSAESGPDTAYGGAKVRSKYLMDSSIEPQSLCNVRRYRQINVCTKDSRQTAGGKLGLRA